MKKTKNMMGKSRKSAVSMPKPTKMAEPLTSVKPGAGISMKHPTKSVKKHSVKMQARKKGY